MLTPKQKLNLKKIFPFGLVWAFFSALFFLLEKGILGDSPVYPSTQNPYEPITGFLYTVPSATIFGWAMGTVEILYLNRIFQKHTFLSKVFSKTFIYVFVIIFFLISNSFLINSIQMNLPITHPEVAKSIWQFFSNLAFWSVAIYIGTIIAITLFLFEVSQNLGWNVTVNYLTGKYHHPREEERIFMFLDMKGSTTIAEKLGHVRYFQLLKEYYADLSDPILKTAGEVYQYVGDEIIVSWPLKKGLKNKACLQCFFLIKAVFEKNKEKYDRQYGLSPSFKAGMHYGKVTTGEIGVIKKEILFTGDVLNTTARIQGMCNEMKTDLLLSEDLLNRLNLPKSEEAEEMGIVELRGREARIKLFTLLKAPLVHS